MSGVGLEARGVDVAIRRPGPTAGLAVRGVDLELAPGSVTGLLGESGAGKTLLARALLGVLPQGVVWAGGVARLQRGPRVVQRPEQPLPPRWAGCVFQDPTAALDPFRSVGVQVAAAAGSTEAALGWLERVGLPDPASVAGLHAHELSGGMAQRAAIAVALAAGPGLIVADEPTTGLDWTLRRGIAELLAGLAREQGATLLLISHDVAVVRHLADEVVVLKQGAVLERSSTARFFDLDPEQTVDRQMQSVLPPRAASRPPGEVLARLRGLRKSYPAGRPGDPPVPALDGVDLELRAGEVVALVGESGSGKTTLARMLVGLDDPDAGELRVLDTTLPGASRPQLQALRRQVQLLFQNGGLNPRLTVLEHLGETLALHRPGEPPARLGEALAALDLQGLGERRPGQLSGGEHRRVALARALLPRPRLLIVDEPTAGLDAPRKASALANILDAGRSDLGVLLITHELDLAQRVADRVVVLHAGRVLQELPARELGPRTAADRLHPGTEALLRAGFGGPGPVPDRRRDVLGACRWAARCHRVEPDDPLWVRCTGERPEAVPLGGGRVACHRFAPAPRLPA